MSSDKKDPALTSATFASRGLLKGDLQNGLPRVVDARAIEEIWREARRRLVPGAIWLMSGVTVEAVAPDALAAFRHVFGGFRKGGGAKIAVGATNPQVIETMRAAVKGFVSLELRIVATYNEAAALAKFYRDLREKNPP